MTQAINAFGTLLMVGDGNISPGPEVFAVIAEVKAIGDFGLGGSVFDATNHSSTGGFEESVASRIKRWEEFDVGVNFIPTDPTQNMTTGLWSMVGDGLAHNFKMQLTDSGTTTWGFAARVMSGRQTTPLDGILDAVFRLKPTGAPTYG